MRTVCSGDRVRINYTGKLPDGRVFDTTDERGPQEVEIGAGKTLLKHEVVVQFGYPIIESEEAPVHALPVAGGNMVGLGLIGVAKALCLCGREVATLLSGLLEQTTA